MAERPKADVRQEVGTFADQRVLVAGQDVVLLVEEIEFLKLPINVYPEQLSHRGPDLLRGTRVALGRLRIEPGREVGGHCQPLTCDRVRVQSSSPYGQVIHPVSSFLHS